MGFNPVNDTSDARVSNSSSKLNESIAESSPGT